MIDPRLVRWRELAPNMPYDVDPVLNPDRLTPDTVVMRNGHPLYRYDHAKTLRCLERFAELGGDRFIVSADIGDMRIGGAGSFRGRGIEIQTDRALPENAILKWKSD